MASSSKLVFVPICCIFQKINNRQLLRTHSFTIAALGTLRSATACGLPTVQPFYKFTILSHFFQIHQTHNFRNLDSRRTIFCTIATIRAINHAYAAKRLERFCKTFRSSSENGWAFFHSATFSFTCSKVDIPERTEITFGRK